MVSPVICQFVAGFLTGHALNNPYAMVTAAALLPGLAGAVERQGEGGHFLHALVADLGQPALDGFGFGAGDGLDSSEQGFRGDYVGES